MIKIVSIRIIDFWGGYFFKSWKKKKKDVFKNVI